MPLTTPSPTPVPAVTPEPGSSSLPLGNYNFILKKVIEPGERYVLLFNNTAVNNSENLYYENTGTLYALKSTNDNNAFTTFTNEISADRGTVTVNTSTNKDCVWYAESYNGSDSQFTLRNEATGQYLAANSSGIEYSNTVSDNTAWMLVEREGEGYP